ncbi:CAP domain-containing protein [Polaromonas jejuensis]|uniref:CAP domain-containing protein n=1 Tax=Polaromonas jejuensis TaxID=457502 RepID=A0ABW0QJ77_9BURK|nr:CAP domain-containing protein [Polaromonas jejuensis]
MKFVGTMMKAHGAWRRAAGYLALAVLAATVQAHAQPNAPDHQPLLRALNAARQQGCDDRPGPATPLRENTRLSSAAALIAGGRKLGDALQASGYRAVRAAQITLRGYSGPAELAQAAVDSSCSTVTEGELAEAGFHQRGTQTWIVLAAPFSPPGAAQAGDVQARVLALVNEARTRPRRCGNDSFAAARPLRLNATLHGVADAHAADMARHNYFSHSGRDGSRVAERASRAGYPWRAIGENIAAGQMQADAVVQGWLNSPGHCANIMSPAYTEMGAAFAVNNKTSAGIYWVQVFGAAR